MAELPFEVDVAVIAAGRCRAGAKHASFIVIEARERVGGGAWIIEKGRRGGSREPAVTVELP